VQISTYQRLTVLNDQQKRIEQFAVSQLLSRFKSKACDVTRDQSAHGREFERPRRWFWRLRQGPGIMDTTPGSPGSRGARLGGVNVTAAVYGIGIMIVNPSTDP
jgi:hypothetical protein